MRAICPNCGKATNPGSKFCAHCGTAISKPPDTLTSPQESNYPLVVQPTMGIVHPHDNSDRWMLRNWWHHQVLRHYGRYHCYAFFLCLPSDIEAIRYLKDSGSEIDLLSGKNCLVIALSKNDFKRSGFDEGTWNAAVTEQVSKGYSLTVSELFKIKYTEFPCLVIFEDIRSPKSLTFTFKNLSAEEISGQMRLIFSLVQQAITENTKPIAKLERHLKEEKLRKVRRGFLDKILNFSGRTFEAAMDAWIKATVK